MTDICLELGARKWKPYCLLKCLSYVVQKKAQIRKAWKDYRHKIRRQRCGVGVRLLKDGLDSLRCEQWLTDNAAQLLCMQDFQEQQTN